MGGIRSERRQNQLLQNSVQPAVDSGQPSLEARRRSTPDSTRIPDLFVYWSLLAYFVAGASFSRPEMRAGELRLMLSLGCAFIAVLIGLRYQVGGDWEAYQLMFTYLAYVDLGRALEVGDPGYQFLNWLVQQIGAEIWLVNLVSGLIFSWGLYRFAKAQADPWLAMVVAIPYLVVVVGMGYSRQAIAIGILMAGLASVDRGGSNLLRFAIYVAVAALFHRTSVVAFPLVAFATQRNTLVNGLIALALAVLLYDLFLQDAMEQFVRHYIEAEYRAQGAAVRVLMNVVPASLFLLFRRRLDFAPRQFGIWRNFSFAAVALFILLLVVPGSAAVDRIALYIIPLQIAVLSRMPGTVMSNGTGRVVVSIYSALVLFVWLNFAAHAEYWIPYRFYPL